MNRRDFIKSGLTACAFTGFIQVFDKKKGSGSIHADSENQNDFNYDLVAVKGSNPDVMFDNGIKFYGGMSRFVKKGQTVVIKPNIGWNKSPEYGANTNPLLVKRVIEHCYNAGAKKVFVFDHTCDNWLDTYKNSGIESSAKNAGAQVVPGNSEKYYQEVQVPGGTSLKITKIHELVLESDVFINIPILKHHGGARLSISMKNLMGSVWDRGFYHYKDLHQCIADFCTYKKPDLNIVDAYYVMTKNGPRGGSRNDVIIKKNQLISTDIVAIDSAAAKIFGSEPEDIPYINKAFKKNIGEIDLRKLKIKRISL